MKAIVKRRGNTACIRIPASVMRAVGLEIGQVVEVKAERGCLVISSLWEYDLSELVRRVTPKNKHRPVDFGPSAGKEFW